MRRSDSELNPRNGHTLTVGVVTRISGRPKQKEASLEDQDDNGRETIAAMYSGPVEFRELACTKAKGEWLDRPELDAIDRAYRSQTFDVIVYDDIGRLIRGGEAAGYWVSGLTTRRGQFALLTELIRATRTGKRMP